MFCSVITNAQISIFQNSTSWFSSKGNVFAAIGWVNSHVISTAASVARASCYSQSSNIFSHNIAIDIGHSENNFFVAIAQGAVKRYRSSRLFGQVDESSSGVAHRNFQNHFHAISAHVNFVISLSGTGYLIGDTTISIGYSRSFVQRDVGTVGRQVDGLANNTIASIFQDNSNFSFGNIISIYRQNSSRFIVVVG